MGVGLVQETLGLDQAYLGFYMGKRANRGWSRYNIIKFSTMQHRGDLLILDLN